MNIAFRLELKRTKYQCKFRYVEEDNEGVWVIYDRIEYYNKAGEPTAMGPASNWRTCTPHQVAAVKNWIARNGGLYERAR